MRRLVIAWCLVAVPFVAWIAAEQSTFSELMLRAVSPKARDLVIVQEPTLPACPLTPASIGCANAVYFNGNWSGVKLCRAKVCVRYEEVFK